VVRRGQEDLLRDVLRHPAAHGLAGLPVGERGAEDPLGAAIAADGVGARVRDDQDGLGAVDLVPHAHEDAAVHGPREDVHLVGVDELLRLADAHGRLHLCLGSVKEKAGKTSQGYTERPCPQNLPAQALGQVASQTRLEGASNARRTWVYVERCWRPSTKYGEANWPRAGHGIQAMQSISTFTPFRGAEASTVVRAGCTPLKYSLNTRLKTGKSSMLRRKTPTLTTCSMAVPPASSTALTLSRVTRVCSARSGETISLVAGSSGPCPETKRNCPHLTPWAMGDSVPSEKPVLGADLVYTTSGFMRTCLPVPSGEPRCPPGTSRRPALRPAPHGEAPRRGPRSLSRTGAPPPIPRTPRGTSCP